MPTLTTSLNRDYALRFLGVAVLLAAFAAWFLYDGLVGYPAENDRVRPVAERLAQEDRTAAEWMNVEKTGVAPLVEAFRQAGVKPPAKLTDTFSSWISVGDPDKDSVEAARAGCAELRLKGKCRRILFPAALVKKLLRYAASQKTAHGPIFRDRNGKPLSRHSVWSEMKKIGRKAGVAASKVFPHNLRHLFAKVFYSLERDLSKLADLLGHSSIETTRIYIATGGCEHLRQLNKMRLII